MFSAKPSSEDLPLSHNKYVHEFRNSLLNRNLSSNNIHTLNQPKPNRQRYQLPISPPLSHPSSPKLEQDTNFQHSSSQSSWLPPINLKILILCFNWYLFSIISNNSTKLILSNFKYPITLTQFQFLLNSIFCISLVFIILQFPRLAAKFPEKSVPNPSEINNSLRFFLNPSYALLLTTLPMGGFQFIGHITSHKATSLIPVSLVHTIKSLSPITTVFIYRFFLKRNYSVVTYLTLCPLILGISLTCYKPSKNRSDGSYYLTGLFYAFISMIIFVSQNIFAKKKLTTDKKYGELPINNGKKEQKFDKLSILFYCSIIGFCLTLPIYILSEFNNTQFSLFNLNSKLLFLIIFNGFSHFIQSLIAFQLLGLVSPINYSIANIFKRIFIILFAFVWESSNISFTSRHYCGLTLTLIGMYCYDKYGDKHN